jgi:integrase
VSKFWPWSRAWPDTRKLINHVAERAGWKAGEIRTKMFRHTYCAARLQTLDGGAPVPLYTVSRELGHTSMAMVQKVYSHLGTIRHRGEAVEYRVEQHKKALAKRLEARAS